MTRFHLGFRSLSSKGIPQNYAEPVKRFSKVVEPRKGTFI